MPSTFNGIGTRYIGWYDPLPDGSYITTKWLVLFLPIIPLESYRVRCIDTKLSISFFSMFSSTTNYIVVQTLEHIHSEGVVRTYAFYITQISCIILSAWLEKSWLKIIPITVFAVLILTWIINEIRKVKMETDARVHDLMEAILEKCTKDPNPEKTKATVSEIEKR